MSLRKPKDKELESYIENHIEEAIEKEWIQVYLQTNIRGLSKRVCGAEALSRWIDPVYGMISPGEFIPVLEKKKKDTSSGPICNGNDMWGAWRKKKTRTVYCTDFDELFPSGF